MADEREPPPLSEEEALKDEDDLFSDATEVSIYTLLCRKTLSWCHFCSGTISLTCRENDYTVTHKRILDLVIAYIWKLVGHLLSKKT